MTALNTHSWYMKTKLRRASVFTPRYTMPHCKCVPSGLPSVSVLSSIPIPPLPCHFLCNLSLKLAQEGELTGVIPPSPVEPQPAMIRKSRHRIWLRDVQPYVFCENYRARNQRKGKADAFEIYFVNEEAATRFKQTFGPPPEPINTATESSDNATAASDM